VARTSALPRLDEVRYAEGRGASIAYTIVGSGPLDVVFVPGFVSHLEVFWEQPGAAHFLRRLTSFARVILWDKREQGLSDRTGVAPTLEQGADDLFAVLDAANAYRPAIIGVSEGGPMSLLFAATHPRRVSSLILYGTHARILRDKDYPEGISEDAVKATVSRLVAEWGSAAGLDLFAPSRVHDPAFAAWWSRLLRSASSRGSVRDVMAINYEIDVRRILPSVRTPALVLHARDDTLVPVRLARYLAERLPDARLVELPLRDHVPFGDAPDLLADEIEEFLTGHRPQQEPQRVLTTVLFTDIVGSTQRAIALGDDRWRGLLARYYDLVDEKVAAFRGRRVTTAGDGTLMSFDGPARAVRCAQAVIDGAAEIDLQVRAGVHTGEAEIIDDDLAGVAVHIGARISALAEAGEVVVSRTVKDLVVGAGLEFTERGEHELRGVPGRWALFSAR
jgi:pimeloyl-ACP methyl ester carboxylesterase